MKMTARLTLSWFRRASTSTVFVVLFAIGQCMAQDTAGTPNQSSSETLKKQEIPETIIMQPDTNAFGSTVTQATKSGLRTDRVKERGRKFHVRDNWTVIEIVKHVSGTSGGLEQGAGPGFGIELTTADSIPRLEFRATILTSDRLYRQFEGEAYIP